MKVVIAIDSFKGSLSSLEAGNAAAEGIHRVFPHADTVVRPVADGGEGTAEALVTGLNGQFREAEATDPLGRKISARYGIFPDNTAIIEMAAASGLTLLSGDERNPMLTTTYGTGELILDAIRNGCRSFRVCLVSAICGFSSRILSVSRIKFTGGLSPDKNFILIP